jgi:predicted RNA-binding protein
MCLSTVYLEKKDASAVFMEEAANISSAPGSVTVQTLFGERKTLDGYSVGEVDLLHHHIVLHKEGA